MNLIKKIANAKKEIKESKLKKEGRNEFSKYDYFTPSQIEFLVQKVCNENGLMTKFDLIRDTLGVFGCLTIFDCESGESLEYKMATAIPEIKATNISQQLGGCMTYTERYLKTSAFGITDNNLDFDSQKPQEKAPQPQVDAKEVLQITEQLKLMTSEAELINYFNQVKPENAVIKALFTKRKAELQNGNK
jgi:hypothetical protein